VRRAARRGGAATEEAIKAVMPETIRLVKDNNRRIAQERMSGGGGR
jgi:hypothetical protein